MKIEAQGDKLVVVDFDVFDALRISCKIERDGMEFYQQLASSVAKQDVKETLELLLGEEKKHLAFFEDSLQRLRDKKEDAGEEDDLLTTMDYGIFSSYPNATELEQILNDMQKAMRLGIAIENKSIQFYEACREKVSDSGTKEGLAHIIAEEKKHKALFEKLKAGLP
jgi:rubrerythrin